ncbi:putative FAD dependent oxidoreductase [Halenospora varia]|nr:putative FAD dependent oxidoreductase [Halenospora varia]
MVRLLQALLIGALLQTTLALPKENKGHGDDDNNDNHGNHKGHPEIIRRDVCIIGGGATGTYAAVRLSQDMGKSVIVVEKTGRLGGHVDTYTDPVTHLPVDYGVLVYQNLPHVLSFFARFNIPLVPLPATQVPNLNIDFTTGKPPTSFSPDPAASATALQTLAGVLQQYPEIASGTYNLTNPVNADLLLPFGDFVAKYHIQAALPMIWMFANGVGDMLKTPSIYIFQNFGLIQLNNLFTGGYRITARHNNSELYSAAAALLGGNVLYNSVAVDIKRNNTGARIVVQTPGGVKIIVAKKLLITAPPTNDNLKPLDLTDAEEHVFKQFTGANYFTGVLRSGVPDNTNVVNVGNNTALNIPLPPFVDQFSFTGIPGLHSFHVVSTSPMSAPQASAKVVQEVARMNAQGSVKVGPSTVETITSHTPVRMQVPGTAIKNGFYLDLYALQGKQNTFWTGHAWAMDESSILWAFTEGVMAQLVATLA